MSTGTRFVNAKRTLYAYATSTDAKKAVGVAHLRIEILEKSRSPDDDVLKNKEICFLFFPSFSAKIISSLCTAQILNIILNIRLVFDSTYS